MLRAKWVAVPIMVLGCGLLAAQDEPKAKSTLKPGDAMPKAFECYNVNGPAKGRPHCLVCGFALYPALLVFAKEPEEGKDEAFIDMLKKLDEITLDFDDRNFQVGIVIVSPDAHDSTNNAKEKDAQAIIDEAVKRKKLYDRVTKRAEGLKNVIISCYPSNGPAVREAPPKGFKLDPKAEVTAFFYERMRLIESFTFEALDAKGVDAMVKKVRDGLPLKKKQAAEK
jgi:hypothetical protein